jgi:hypothetical protein
MLRAIVVVLLLVLLPSHARAEAKIALLIGNEAYANEIGRLANPHNDVTLLEGALKGLGFEVVTVRDAGLGALNRAVNGYARHLQAAGPGAIGFFYYSGHGASDGSTNYLIPVDAKTTETSALWDESLRLTEITSKLKAEAGNATHFVVFDACRNTLKLTQPGFRAVVQSKGFVPVAQENGMLIAYATAEGQLASDVGAGAGPYANALAQEIVKPGVEAVVMFRAVQRRVRATIGQEPYLGFNALGDVYLAGNTQQSTAAPLQETAPTPDCPDCPELIAVPIGARSLLISRTLITRGHWASCQNAKACPFLVAQPDNSIVDDPVILSWHEAQKFTAWLSNKTGHTYRLLKSDEWEFVAQSIGGADKGKTDLGKVGLEWTADCWPADTLLLKIADMMNEGCAFRIVRNGQKPAWKNGARGLGRSANVGFRVLKEN